MAVPDAWDPADASGHPALDAEHRALLSQCAALGFAPAFDDALAQLTEAVRRHLDAEAGVLDALGDPQPDEHQGERDEFEMLVRDVATRQHFEPAELQRFLAVWCIGHVRGSATRLRALSASAAR